MISLDITLLFQVVNFLVGLVILKKLIIGPVLGIMAKRRAVNDALTGEAQGLNEKAGARLEQYEKRLLKTRADIAARRESLKSEGEKSSQVRVDGANEEARAIRQDAASSMAAESAQARAVLSGKVADYAGLAMGKLLDA